MAILVRRRTEVSYNIGLPLAGATILIRLIGGGSMGPGVYLILEPVVAV